MRPEIGNWKSEIGSQKSDRSLFFSNIIKGISWNSGFHLQEIFHDFVSTDTSYKKLPFGEIQHVVRNKFR